MAFSDWAFVLVVFFCKLTLTWTTLRKGNLNGENVSIRLAFMQVYGASYLVIKVPSHPTLGGTTPEQLALGYIRKWAEEQANK